jgi:mannan endo-1,4-beta-mannosidase
MVRTAGTGFTAEGSPFPVVGVNCYFLSRCGDAGRESTLASIQAAGANTIRSTAFHNPAGLGQLDALVASAERDGLRLILPLVNYWDDFDGMSGYLERLFPGERLARQEFYSRPEARAAFQEWIATVVDRPYRDSPAILAWELANEPRCGRDCGPMLAWIAEMAAFVKSLDPNHLVAAGDEGHAVVDEILAIPEIDFGTYHFYPAAHQMNVPPEYGREWIARHIDAGRRANKPVLLEEYGIAGPYRDAWYAEWQSAVCEFGGAGDLVWMMGGRHPEVAAYRDEYTVYSAEEIPSLARHAAAMLRRT